MAARHNVPDFPECHVRPSFSSACLVQVHALFKSTICSITAVQNPTPETLLLKIKKMFFIFRSTPTPTSTPTGPYPFKIIFCGRDSGRKKWNKRIMNAERRIMQETGHTRFFNHFFLGAKRPKKKHETTEFCLVVAHTRFFNHFFFGPEGPKKKCKKQKLAHGG